jgi:hypothetical protein
MDEARANELFEYGVQLFKSYDYTGTIEAWEQVLILAPNFRDNGDKIREMINGCKAAKADHDIKEWAAQQARKFRS